MARFYDETYDTPQEAEAAAEHMGLSTKDFEISLLVYEDGTVDENQWGIYLFREG